MVTPHTGGFGHFCERQCSILQRADIFTDRPEPLTWSVPARRRRLQTNFPLPAHRVSFDAALAKIALDTFVAPNAAANDLSAISRAFFRRESSNNNPANRQSCIFLAPSECSAQLCSVLKLDTRRNETSA